MGNDNEAMGLRAVLDIGRKIMTKFATAALALCVGFSGLNVAEAATSKPLSTTPVVVKPTAVKPTAVKTTATSTANTSVTRFGSGLWESLSVASKPGGITSRALQYLYFVPKTDEFEEKIIVEGDTGGEVEAGGDFYLTGIYKKVSPTKYDYEFTSATECIAYCSRDPDYTLDKVYSETVISLAPNWAEVNGVDWYAPPQ
jgi:hypothetical protein